MNQKSLKEWFFATRPWSFTVSIIPVVASFLYLATVYGFAQLNWANFILALVGMVLFHAAGNLISDWNDYRSGVDNEKSAVQNLVQGRFTPKEYIVLGCVLFVLATAVGIVLTFLSSAQLLIIGGIGALLTALYAFFKGHAMGELDIFLNFAVLPMIGTSLVTYGAIDWSVLVLALPIGFVTVAVLFINNTRDMQSDKAAGITTFSMKLGKRNSVRWYLCLIFLPLIYMVVSVALGWLSWTCLLALIGIVPAIKIFTAARQFDKRGDEAIMTLDLATAQMQTVFGGALSIGLLLSALIF